MFKIDITLSVFRLNIRMPAFKKTGPSAAHVVDKARFKLLPVTSRISIQDFADENGIDFAPGRGNYDKYKKCTSIHTCTTEGTFYLCIPLHPIQLCIESWVFLITGLHTDLSSMMRAQKYLESVVSDHDCDKQPSYENRGEGA